MFPNKSLKTERAVKLFMEKMITLKTNPRSTHLGVRKIENPETKKNSGFLTDFSWEHWNDAAVDYLQSVNALNESRILEVLNKTFFIPDHAGRKMRHTGILRHSQLLNSGSARATLHSDTESDNKESDPCDGDAGYQAPAGKAVLPRPLQKSKHA